MRKLILFASLFTISCSLFVNENDGYEDALEIWQENKSSDYTFDYNIGCFCPSLVGPARIVVQADTIYQVLNPETNELLMIEVTQDSMVYALDIFPSFYHTIDGLFEIVKEARKNADDLDVEYNKEIGYPESISIDYYKDAVDDEVSYSVTDYKRYESFSVPLN